MLDMAARAEPGAFNAISQPGSVTWGELLASAREVTGGRAELRWVAPELIEARVEEPWEALPLWPIPSLPGLYGMSAQRAARAGLQLRPAAETVADTWAWLSAGGELDAWRRELRAPGLSPEVERDLLNES
jgi:2'-hydroxyisoflavone reductase